MKGRAVPNTVDPNTDGPGSEEWQIEDPMNGESHEWVIDEGDSQAEEAPTEASAASTASEIDEAIELPPPDDLGDIPVPKRRKRSRGERQQQNIAVLGFSASGKTVFLSMLYHATGVQQKFAEGWRVEWTTLDGGKTARYLRDTSNTIMGVLRSGKTDWVDDKRTNVKRAFPPGTTLLKELQFMMTRNWHLMDFPLAIRTLDGSGEVIHRAFIDGIENLTGDVRDHWERIAELCRNSSALMLFANILNVDEIQNSGEMHMLLEWLLAQRRKPKAIAVVVTGTDILHDQHEVEETRKRIRKKYSLIFEMLEAKRVAYEIIMVSALGDSMVSKKTDNLKPGCMGADHLCPECQELVDDPNATPTPINIDQPFEFIFGRLLKWYERWPPLAVTTGILQHTRRILFNRFVTPIIVLGLLAWGGYVYWINEDELYTETTDLVDRVNEDDLIKIESNVGQYATRYGWWRKRELAVLRRDADAHAEFAPLNGELTELLARPSVTSASLSNANAKVVVFLTSHKDSRVDSPANEWVERITLQLDINTLMHQRSLNNLVNTIADLLGRERDRDIEAEFLDACDERLNALVDEEDQQLSSQRERLDNIEEATRQDGRHPYSIDEIDGVTDSIGRLKDLADQVDAWDVADERMNAVATRLRGLHASLNRQWQRLGFAAYLQLAQSHLAAGRYIDTLSICGGLRQRQFTQDAAGRSRLREVEELGNLAMRIETALTSSSVKEARTLLEELETESVGQTELRDEIATDLRSEYHSKLLDISRLAYHKQLADVSPLAAQLLRDDYQNAKALGDKASSVGAKDPKAGAELYAQAYGLLRGMSDKLADAGKAAAQARQQFETDWTTREQDLLSRYGSTSDLTRIETQADRASTLINDNPLQAVQLYTDAIDALSDAHRDARENKTQQELAKLLREQGQLKSQYERDRNASLSDLRVYAPIELERAEKAFKAATATTVTVGDSIQKLTDAIDLLGDAILRAEGEASVLQLSYERARKKFDDMWDYLDERSGDYKHLRGFNTSAWGDIERARRGISSKSGYKAKTDAYVDLLEETKSACRKAWTRYDIVHGDGRSTDMPEIFRD